MAPSSGQVLVPKAVKAFKYMLSKGAGYIRARLAQGGGAAKHQLEAIPVRIGQPLHPLAALRQGRNNQQRHFSTALHRVISAARGSVQVARPVSSGAIRSAITKTYSAPFSSPLRPNLTGGTLPRSASGYSLGGNGVRQFSSIPAAQAHVVQNVSAAMRAFCMNGFKVQYDGLDASGAKRFRTITPAQDKALRRMTKSSISNTKGTSLEFRIAPTITALAGVNGTENTLESQDVLSGLASDFSRSLSSLALVHADLRKLSALGSLPISYPNAHTLSIRFAGCDARTVYALCNELGIQRGIVREDAEWDEHEGDHETEMALLFPWAPSVAPSVAEMEAMFESNKTRTAAQVQGFQEFDWKDMLSASTSPRDPEPATPSSDELSQKSYSLLQRSHESATGSDDAAAYDVLNESDLESNEDLAFDLARLGPSQTTAAAAAAGRNVSAEADTYQDMQGILKFWEECDRR